MNRTTGYAAYDSDSSSVTSTSSSSITDTDDGYTSEESLLNVPGKKPPVETGGPAPAAVVVENTLKNVGTKFESAESKNTTLFMINSRDRDTRVFPQPTFFTMRLPRVFKNVKTINISQLNLLNSFFNFSTSKGNTTMYVYENGRIVYDPATGTDISNAIKITIRNGTYTADDLVAELNNAMNSTPLFADITLGNFISLFQGTGDFSPMFNTPGTVVYNSLTQTYDRNQTIQTIIGRYFQTVQNVGTVSYTYNQCSVAYYYPIIKEMIIAQPSPVPFDTIQTDPPPGFTSWYDYLVFAFQGLDDPYVTAIVTNAANQAIFDTYRFENTFNRFLVNKYTCTYNAKQGRLVITAPSLNDSITNDLTTRYNQLLTQLVLANGFSNVADFQNKYNSINNSNGALIEFYNYIQSRFSSNFGVSFGTYSAEFYSDSNNEINIYNTLNRYGWNLSLTPEVSQSTISSNAPAPQEPNYWPNILIPKLDAPDLVSALTVPQFTNGLLEFSNAGESQFGYTDISFSIMPTHYVRTAFRSRCRQNISLMTLPRYVNERSPGTEEVYNFGSTITQTPLLFDTRMFPNVYLRTDISGNANFNMYDISQNMFYTPDYMRALDIWLEYTKPQILSGSRVQSYMPNFQQKPPKGDIAITSYRPYMFFQMNADRYLVEPRAHFNVSFYVETQDGENFSVPIVISWYKDRAGFMADVADDLTGSLGNENPRHYFKRTVYGTDLSSAVMVVDVNNDQQTYFHVTIESGTIIPSAIPLRVFCVLTDVYGTYTLATQLDKLDMPYSGLPPIADQFTPASAVFKDPTTSIYDKGITQLGYDILGVSNNLLDYIVQAAGNTFYDPNNVTEYFTGNFTGLRYQFDVLNVGSGQPAPNISSPTQWSLYFGSNSANFIRDTYSTTTNIYLDRSIPPKPLQSSLTNEFTLVNWFNPVNTQGIKETFLTPAATGGIMTAISTSSVFLPCINASAPLATDVFTSTGSAALDISGFCGISFFLPPSDIVKLDSLLMKFAYTQPSADSNATGFIRSYNPSTIAGSVFTNAFYRNQATKTHVVESGFNEWDDWYAPNRRNLKLGIFNSADISGASTVSLSSALTTMTLDRVSQINNFQNQLGTARTREPDWGTYYKYTYDPQLKTRWDLSGSEWRTTLSQPDFAPTFSAGDSNYNQYFLTHAEIKNYTYLPRSYGIAPSVGNAVNFPYSSISSFMSDIPNSYTAVPFYYDAASASWKMGSFYGLSYTRKPALPSTGLIGAAPYDGPMGIYAWTKQAGTIQLALGEQASFQPYYFNSKLSFETLDIQYNPATDLAAFGGYAGITGEYQDTMMFFYANSTIGLDYRDISTNATTWKWGQESNAVYYDADDQSGYNYLSYIHDVPVRSSMAEYAVHVRAYDPIPSFNTGLRFIGKNYTDYGRPRLMDICLEISSLSGYHPITDVSGSAFVCDPVGYNALISTNNAIRYNPAAGNYFSHNYADSLVTFDRRFVASTIFGKRIGYTGVPFTFGGYCDALTQYVDYFSTIRGAYSLYTNILSTATGQLNDYVIFRYGDILPSSILNRNRLTDPLPFQLLFKSKLVEPYKSRFDEWGLGYNLGFNKADTFPPRTTVTSDTFIRITQDYVYLRLSPEHNTNMMGVSSKENFAETQESRGQDAKYFSKILLNNFGSFCRAAVQMPKQFQPVLGKYERITCELVDANGDPIDNPDCNYDFVLEITEITNGPTDNSSLNGPGANLGVYQSR
jgi:hypothetical protein